ncbi:MAG: response regulator, partial [Geobacteraceae bacterium]|nr:response regulator [Geobacteraceae bacterium]
MRVLIVDNEPELCEQIALILRQQQYTVDIAGDGTAALEKFFTDLYDLIVLDIMLPEKEGLAVPGELRKDGGAIPVLMLTAKEEGANWVKGFDLG